ncbi:MAG: hypothetical protein Q7J38_00660 [Gallionella sp.]|nr:hypothetical protein [Gallionella sp.]
MNTQVIQSNPFEYDAALNLPPEMLIDWYIEDHNFARVLRTTRNVLINGHRGSGKSMMLIYNSLRFQKLRHESKQHEFPPTHVGIYVPCNTPLTHRQDHELMPVGQQVTISEFYFVMAIIEAIAEAFELTSVGFISEDFKILTDEIKTIMPNIVIDEPSALFTQVRRNIKSQLINLQQSLQKGIATEVEYNAVSFYSMVTPILAALKRTSVFKQAHFSILIDDAHDLNPHQKRLLNSWLSYRDHSVFSFKVAVAGLRSHNLRTLSGGTILEGHDYLILDLEQPFQNEESNYAQFAKAVIEQRLAGAGLHGVSARNFFPQSPEFEAAIEAANLAVTEEYLKEKGWDPKNLTPEQKKSVSDHVYKYGRAKYFRERDPKSNLPTYAGFDTLVHLSTGVIRNLLNPCYQMFDAEVSEHTSAPKNIPPSTQSEIVKAKSDEAWEQIRRGLENVVEGCTKEDADHLCNLLTALGDYFVKRLAKHKSEPRILSFIISEAEVENMKFLDNLFRVAQEAQLLYIRSGSSKTRGRREDYFTPNKILWPVLGLDVHGQHGRASITSRELVDAARYKKAIKENIDSRSHADQLGLI